MARYVVLDNPTIQGTLLTDPQILQEFPWLQTLSGQIAPLNCPGCQLHRYPDSVRLLQETKRRIAEMPAEQQLRLKQLLGASSVRVFYIDEAGKDQPKTF